MKIRKDYFVTVLPFRRVVVLTKQNNSWTNWMQLKATCGCTIFDCTFQQAVQNLKFFSEKGYYIQKRKRGK